MKGCVMNRALRIWRLPTAAAAAALLVASAASSAAADPRNPFEALFGPVHPPVSAPAYANSDEDTTELRSELRRQIVSYRTSEAPGTVIVDTAHTFLYLVLPGGRAMRYGIRVGREGFT